MAEAPAGASRMARAMVGLGATAMLALAFAWALPVEAALWVKAVHVIAVIAWMAGMLYLPRLFVYHSAAAPGSELSETLKVMERRLYRLIINPAMILSWASGLWMAWAVFSFRGGWLHGKFLLVLILSGIHGYLGAALRRFAEDRNRQSARAWRLVNEVPTVLMIGIVVLVIVKPF